MIFHRKIPTSFIRLSLYGIIACGLFIFVLLFLGFGPVPALFWAFTPILCFFLVYLLKNPEWAFHGVFIANYVIMGLTRYITGIPGGVVIDILLLLVFMITLFRGLEQPIQWSNIKDPFIALTSVWLVYCCLLVFHPDTSLSTWSAGIRGLAVYLFVFPFLVSLLFGKFKYLKIFLYIWSVLTLLAIIKALIQKFYGFDAVENSWLYDIGGARTHIIYTGVRYFSFFTDAASFGSSMGLSMIVFAIYSFYEKNNYLKVYFLLIALGAGYGLMISGTRAAIAVPFIGFLIFLLLSRQWKILVPGFLLLLCVFAFFKYTHIGNENINIFRIRSAFHATEDASFNVRLENQKKMWTFMKNKPFGIGIGKAKRAEPGDYMYQLPTDTSLVYIWVETGVVGLVFFLFIFLFVLAKGAYDVLFKIRNKQLRGILCAFLAGIAGMLVCSYGNEMLQQFPNGPIVYTLMAFVMLGTRIDNQLSSDNETDS